MSESAPPSALAATCTQCGGTLEVTLTGPAITCPYCDAADPLPPDLAKRVDGLRERLASQARRERQLVGKQAQLGQTFGYFFLVAILCVWVVVAGGLAVWPLFEPPKGWTAWAFLTTEYRGTEWMDDNVMKWWACFSVVSGFWLTVTLWLATLVSLRRVVRWALPRPPSAPGRPPRCRCCGAELGTDGVVRRCRHCDADHVVMGERYQAQQAALEGTLQSLEAQLEQTLAARNQRIERLFGVAGTLPIGLAMFAPLLGLVFTRTDPRMWIVPGALIVTSALLVVWCERWRPPEIPSFEFLQAGDSVFLHGVKLQILGILDLQNSLARLHLVGAGATPTAGFQVTIDEDGKPDAVGFTVTRGGKNLSANDVPKGSRFELRRSRGLGDLSGRQSVWGVLGPVVGGVPEHVRLVFGQPKPCLTPTFTVTPEGKLSEAELSLFGSAPSTSGKPA